MVRELTCNCCGQQVADVDDVRVCPSCGGSLTFDTADDIGPSDAYR
jgi:rRNA maturation endonuclease Nob1